MGKKYYSFEEIKTKFKSYKDLKESAITNDEYDRFCDEIKVLPIEIVDKIHNEIQFVLLSADPVKGNPACYVSLKEVFEEGKKGIIVLTPYIFGTNYFDKEGIKRRLWALEKPCILHEVAHHVLDHTEYKNQKDIDEKEEAAWKKVEDWLLLWTEYEANIEDELCGSLKQ